MSKTLDILIDDYIKDVKFHKLEILPQMISKKEAKQKKYSVNGNNQKKEKSNFIYYEIRCLENQKKIKELIINNQNIIQISENIYDNLSNLTLLNLSNNSISNISEKIVQLSNLKHLILNNNIISLIPFYLSDLIYLEEIQLENNLVQLIPLVIQNFNALKILSLSSNKLEKLPVELGLVKNLEILLIDKNEYTEIPTTICYLKKLKRIKLEWFEFARPSIDIDLRDINTISSFKLILKERLLLSNLYIDFHTLILKISQDKLMDESINTFETEKTECYNNSSFDIFHALNNNYQGVIKSFVKDNPEIINSKDSNGKTPLFLSIQQGRRAIYEYFLSKIEVKAVPNNYSLLFKAIRMRNFPLVVKLNKLGISLNVTDDKGNNVYHILFSVFNKNYDQCCQIGNYFIENEIDSYNNVNNDGWGPIHIASKYANFVCLEWISYINNNILRKKNKELIDINLLGKNNWTALHLAVSSYKYSECIKLLELNSNLFARNSEGRLPRYITNNFFLTKMLYKKEFEYYYNKLCKSKTKKKSNSSRYNNKLYDKKNKIFVTCDNFYSYKVNNNITSSNYKKATENFLSYDDKIPFSEKYKLIMMLSLNDNKDEVEFKCKELLYKIDFNITKNHIIISDILSIISKYNLTKLITDLKKLKNKLKENNFLKNDFNSVINYLEQIKNGKINIITKINIYIKGSNSNDEGNTYNNRYQTSINQSNNSKTNKLLKRPATMNEKVGGKKDNEEINYIRSIREKLMNNTTHKKNSNSNNNKNLGTSGFKKLQEKNIQESGNSVDFELDDTIKNF